MTCESARKIKEELYRRKTASQQPRHDQKKYNIVMPASMLDIPMKRICPSFICVRRSNTARHWRGLRNGSSPSMTSSNANAPSSKSQTSEAAN